VGIFGAVLAARRRWWIVALACAALAMFSKEHGVIAVSSYCSISGFSRQMIRRTRRILASRSAS